VAVLVSLIVTDALVATIVPPVLSVRTATVNVSAPSVVESAVGVMLKVPEFAVTVKLPEDVAKSPALVSTVQYNVVPLETPVVVITNVPALPSLILPGVVVNAYVPLTGVVLVSLIVTGDEVATTGPVTVPVLISTVNVSAPSVFKSAVGVTANDPTFAEITKLPVVVAKSVVLGIFQYRVVLFATPVVAT
jgi:hypothetical protein